MGVSYSPIGFSSNGPRGGGEHITDQFGAMNDARKGWLLVGAKVSLAQGKPVSRIGGERDQLVGVVVMAGSLCRRLRCRGMH